MKINFAQLETYTDIQKTNKICLDARQQLGELIYEAGSGITAHALALKIYNIVTGKRNIQKKKYKLLCSL